MSLLLPALLLFSLTAASVAAPIAAGDAMVRPEDLRAEPLQLAGARGEYESFQLRTPGSFRLTRFTAADGSTLPPPAAFRMENVQLPAASPHASEPPGPVPDKLVPGDPMRLGAEGLWWIDQHIPREAKPGDYAAEVFSTADGTKLALKLTVWPAQLPEVPALRSGIGCSWRRIADLHGLPQDSGSEKLKALTRRYHALLAEHSLCPRESFPLGVEVGPDGTLTHFPEQAIREHIALTRATMLALPIYESWPFAAPTRRDQPAAVKYLSALMGEMQRCGWEKLCVVACPVDEPSTAEAYAQVRGWGLLCRTAEQECGVRIPLLCTEQPTPENPAWGTLAGAVDIWTVLHADLWRDLQTPEPETPRRMSAGEQVWCYAALVQYPDAFLASHGRDFRGPDAHPPVWLTDHSRMNYRISPWLCAAQRWSGLLYWDALHWPENGDPQQDNGTFREGKLVFNGDGQLLYTSPDGPLPSVRLKWLRDGMEDHSLFTAASQQNLTAAKRIVRAIAPSVDAWRDNPAALRAARASLARLAAP